MHKSDVVLTASSIVGINKLSNIFNRGISWTQCLVSEFNKFQAIRFHRDDDGKFTSSDPKVVIQGVLLPYLSGSEVNMFKLLGKSFLADCDLRDADLRIHVLNIHWLPPS